MMDESAFNDRRGMVCFICSCSSNVPQLGTLLQFGHKEMLSILGWPIAPSYMSPNAGWGLRGLSQWVQLWRWSPNKLYRSNSMFTLCLLYIWHNITPCSRSKMNYTKQCHYTYNTREILFSVVVAVGLGYLEISAPTPSIFHPAGGWGGGEGWRQ